MATLKKTENAKCCRACKTTEHSGKSSKAKHKPIKRFGNSKLSMCLTEIYLFIGKKITKPKINKKCLQQQYS